MFVASQVVADSVARAAPHERLDYRPEIDGLRAVAVLPVVAFHAGASFLPGGFLGVDVFFVVSGYLITSIIAADLSAGKFSFVRFYERRARRILPALFFVMAVTLAAAWFATWPGTFRDLAKVAASVALFSSNILFASRAGYFSPDGNSALLHTWSLAVEEQFYIAFPFLLFALARFNLSRKVWTVITLAVLSFVACLIGGHYYRDANFFILPSRAWELFAGAILALIPRQNFKPNGKGAGVLPYIGIVLIVASMLRVDSSSAHLGFVTVLPVAGTMLVIAYGHSCRALQWPPLVAVGLASYSIYLWHVPAFALFGFAGAWQTLALFVAVLVVSFLTWRYVELPFRRRDVVTAKAVWAFAACGALFFIALPFVLPAAFKAPPHLSASFKRKMPECLDRAGAHDTAKDWLCLVGPEKPAPDYIAFGDSHAYAMFPALRDASKLTGQTGALVAYSGCPPVLGVYPVRGDQGVRDCHALNSRVAEYIGRNSIKKVFLIAKWAFYVSPGPDRTNIRAHMSDAASLAVSQSTMEKAAAETVRAFVGMGARVFIVSQVPNQPAHAASIYERAFTAGESRPYIDAMLQELSVSRTMHIRTQSLPMQILRPAIEAGATLINTTDIFCGPYVCPVGDAEHSLYFDDDHLSATGSAKLTDTFATILRSAQ